jgi:hypothetical protein
MSSPRPKFPSETDGYSRSHVDSLIDRLVSRTRREIETLRSEVEALRSAASAKPHELRDRVSDLQLAFDASRAKSLKLEREVERVTKALHEERHRTELLKVRIAKMESAMPACPGASWTPECGEPRGPSVIHSSDGIAWVNGVIEDRTYHDVTAEERARAAEGITGRRLRSSEV